MKNTRNICLLLVTIFLVPIMAADPSFVTFSFASDDNHDGPTFKGGKRNVSGNGNFDLIIDLNEHDKGGLVTFATKFKFKGQIQEYERCRIGGGIVHQWILDGYYEFNHFNAAGNPLLLKVEFKNALMVSYSPTDLSAGPTMTIQNSRDLDQGISITIGEQLVCLGVNNDNVSEDFAFTLTHLLDDAGSRLIELNARGLFLNRWESEGSYSSSFQREVIPQ